MGRVISTAIRFIDGFTRPSKAVIDNMIRMGNEAIKAGKQIQNAGKTITYAGAALTKTVTLPIAGVATAAVKTAADFESAMSEVGAISGASAGDMATLTAKAKEMGATTAFSASESAEAMKYMAMAGWKTKDMTEGIAGIMNLAAASGEDLAATSDIVTDGLTAFGMAARESSRFADVMAATSSNANTNVALMGETFKYCASTAGAMGYSIEDISVAIGIMGNAGIKGSMAGTTLKNTIANLAKPTDAQAAVMERLGISLTDSSGNMKSFAEVMDNLRTSFAGLSETEKAAAATTLAGKQSMAGLLTIVNAGTEDFDKLTEAINGSAGTAGEMAAKMLDNLNGQLTLLKSATEGILITVGNRLMPYVKTGVSWVQKAADYINNLNDAQLDNIIKWAGIAAAIGPAVMAFGKIVLTIGKVKTMFGTITKTIANFGGIMGVITSPAGIVIGVLAGIALAAFLIIKNWDKVKGVLQGVGSWFKNAFEEAGFSVEDFKTGFISVIDGIATAVEKGRQVFGALLSFFTGAFAGNWDNAAQGFRNSLKNIFPSDIAGDLIDVFDGILPVIKGVTEGIKKALKGLIPDLKNLFGDIKETFGGFGTFFKGVFSGDIEMAFEGLRAAAGGILDIIGDLVTTRINEFKNFVTGALGNFLPESTINKIAGAFDVIAKAWNMAIGNAKDALDGLLKAVRPLVDNLKSIFGGIGQLIKGVLTGDWKSALEGLNSMVRGTLSGLVNIIKAPFTIIGNVIKGSVEKFKVLNVIKNIFASVGNAIKNVLSKSGVNLEEFGERFENIKTRICNMMNTTKTTFQTVFNAIGTVAGKVVGFVAKLLGKEIGEGCSTAQAKLNVLVEVFDYLSIGIKASLGIVASAVKVAFSVIGSVISTAVYSITSIFSGLMTILDGITTFVSGVFTGNWKKAWDGVKTIFAGIFEAVCAIAKTSINTVISIINGAIEGINKLGINVPEWVPVIGGQVFHIDVPTIPMLYKGTDNWRGGTAVIHDRGGEIVDLPRGTRVYPHDKSIDIIVYYLLDTIVFAVVTRNICCGGVKLRAIRYNSEEKREQFDNNNNSVYSIATILGSVIAAFLELNFKTMLCIATFGNMIDNLFYIFIFCNTRKRGKINEY